jgi:hypothetical protein
MQLEETWREESFEAKELLGTEGVGLGLTSVEAEFALVLPSCLWFSFPTRAHDAPVYE